MGWILIRCTWVVERMEPTLIEMAIVAGMDVWDIMVLVLLVGMGLGTGVVYTNR